jgi:hypothetical protein
MKLRSSREAGLGHAGSGQRDNPGLQRAVIASVARQSRTSACRHCERSAAIPGYGMNQLEIAASLRSSQRQINQRITELHAIAGTVKLSFRPGNGRWEIVSSLRSSQ